MWKSTIALVIGFIVLLAVVVALEPSPQEAVLANLNAAEGILDKVETSQTPAKFEEARKVLANTKLSGKSEAVISQTLKAIDDLEASVEGDRAKIRAASSEIKSQIEQAKTNLPSSSAIERAKAVKDQLLALLWPLIIVLLVVYVLHSKGFIDSIKQLATTVSNLKIPGGLEIAFHSTEVKSTLEEALKDYRDQVTKKYDALAAQYQIAETLARIAEGPIAEFLKGKKLAANFRCTIHVRDTLLDNSLYQLTDYVAVGRKATGGKGRAWSVRRGMIGRCWRLEKSEVMGSVTNNKHELIENWALIKDEVEYVERNQSILCHLMTAQNQSPLGVLYLDSEPASAFGDQNVMDAFMQAVAAAVKKFKLDDALEQVWEQAKRSAPLIKIYDDGR